MPTRPATASSAVWENGFRQITNTKQPIVKPDDLKGIKLRVPAALAREDVQGLRRQSDAARFSEVFVALQTGAMDAQENPLAQIYSGALLGGAEVSVDDRSRLHAVLRHRRRELENLPADVQKILVDMRAKEMQAYVAKMAADSTTNLLAKIKDAGMQVNEADKEAFIKASKPIYEEFAQASSGRQGADRQGARARQEGIASRRLSGPAVPAAVPLRDAAGNRLQLGKLPAAASSGCSKPSSSS